MEILFIWLFDYKNFKEQGFNFSSEFIFNVEKDNKKSYKLNISKNKNFIPNFFEKSNILNVTAIIGQNGSGKSNILDFIKNSFPEGYSSIQAQAIIAYRLKGDTEKKILLIPNNSFNVEVNQNENDFEIHNYPFDMPTEADGLYGQDYSTAEYVFYSNIFDLKSEEINMAGLHNLSTLALLKADTSEHDEKQLLASGGSYDSFRANEIRRNIQFLLSDYTDLLKNFPLPEHLFIEILDNDLKYFQKDKNPDVQKLLTFFKEELLQKDLSIDTRFLNNLYISVFLNFLTTDREFSSLGGFISKVTFSKNDTIKSYIFNFFKNLPNVKYHDKNLEQEIPITNHEKKSKIAIEFFNYIEKLLEKKSFKIEKERRTNRSTIQYSINEESFEELTKFLDLYINLKGLTDFLDFNWRNLSSGEQSMFTFISRFYHLKHHQIQHEDLKKNMVILIDEGDIYFHPAWQKKFFQITIDYLSKLLKDHNLQFIFTANTPFITSDLPKSNVIFIEKTSRRKVHVHGADNDRAETFGGNIHTLFADSFYMEGALMGEFAKDKINKIIKYLTGESKQKKDDYKKTIDIIGEPVLKRKLQEMWFEKFGVEEEIAELQKRIEELKKKK
jgi:predicted ATP-binding protein involved in virulence